MSSETEHSMYVYFDKTWLDKLYFIIYFNNKKYNYVLARLVKEP